MGLNIETLTKKKKNKTSLDGMAEKKKKTAWADLVPDRGRELQGTDSDGLLGFLPPELQDSSKLCHWLFTAGPWAPLEPKTQRLHVITYFPLRKHQPTSKGWICWDLRRQAS